MSGISPSLSAAAAVPGQSVAVSYSDYRSPVTYGEIFNHSTVIVGSMTGGALIGAGIGLGTSGPTGAIVGGAIGAGVGLGVGMVAVHGLDRSRFREWKESQLAHAPVPPSAAVAATLLPMAPPAGEAAGGAGAPAEATPSIPAAPRAATRAATAGTTIQMRERPSRTTAYQIPILTRSVTDPACDNKIMALIGKERAKRLICPLTKRLVEDPVRCCKDDDARSLLVTNYVYERRALETPRSSDYVPSERFVVCADLVTFGILYKVTELILHNPTTFPEFTASDLVQISSRVASCSRKADMYRYEEVQRLTTLRRDGTITREESLKLIAAIDGALSPEVSLNTNFFTRKARRINIPDVI